MRNYIYLLSLFGALFYAKHMDAQTKQQKPKKVFYSIGAGTALIPEFEGADNYRILPIINFSANWMDGKYIRVNGLNTEFNVLANRKWNFGPVIIAKINRDNSVSNREVALLPELDLAIGTGFFGRYNIKNFDVKISYSHDITGVNNGGLGNIEIGYTYRNKKVIYRTLANTSFATANYLNTYFGIDENIVSTLPSYELESGFKDVGFSTSLVYLFNKKWMLGTAIRYNILIGDVSKSPIVKSGNQHQIITALFAAYRF